MKVTYNDKEASVGNLLEGRVDELLEEIYGGSTETTFEVNTDNLLDAAKAEASLIAGNWNMVAKTAVFQDTIKKLESLSLKREQRELSSTRTGWPRTL